MHLRVPIAALAASVTMIGAAHADGPVNPRIALVIGESAYADATLPTTANDAGLVAQVLQAAGFDVVGARDLDGNSVRAALRDFLDKANAIGPNMQAFVYFSGRALQYSGDNFLVPIDARISRDTDAPIEAVKLSDFTHALAAAPGLARIVVVDGARANPYATQGDPLAGGLALIEPERGELIAYNAAPGAIAGDEAGPYGVYAKTLAGQLREGGVDIPDVFAGTRIAVNQATAGAQAPWSVSKLTGPYFVFERAADAAPPKVKRPPAKKRLKDYSAEDAYSVAVERDSLDAYQEYLHDYPRALQAKRVQAILAARREALFWERSWRDNSPRAYWTYLKRYPHGPHAPDASRRLRVLSAELEPPRDFAPEEYEDLPPPPPAEIVYADRPYYSFGGDDFGPPPPRPPREYYVEDDDDDWRDLPPPPPPTALGLLPALAVAIPLLIESRGYHDKPRKDGRAEPGAAPPPPAPKGPPPLPKGVKPVAVKGGPTPVATPTPVVTPVVKPTPGATPTPSMTPTVKPTPVATPTPSMTPTVKPTPVVTPTPLMTPTVKPTPVATPTPSMTPTVKPTPVATPTPSMTPTVKPTPVATPTPSMTPTVKPTSLPTPSPTPTVHGGGAKPTPTSSALPTPLPSPDAVKAAPKAEHSPAAEKVAPTPAAEKPAPKVAPTPAAEKLAPKVAPTPAAEKPAPKVAPTPAAEKPAPKVMPSPAAEKPAPKVEHVPAAEKPAPKVAPSPAAEKPAPKVEHVPAAEKPAPKVERVPAAEKPAPKVAPSPVAEKPAPKVEHVPAAEKPAPKPAPAAAAAEPAVHAPAKPEKACGQPGKPACT